MAGGTMIADTRYRQVHDDDLAQDQCRSVEDSFDRLTRLARQRDIGAFYEATATAVATIVSLDCYAIFERMEDDEEWEPFLLDDSSCYCPGPQDEHVQTVIREGVHQHFTLPETEGSAAGYFAIPLLAGGECTAVIVAGIQRAWEQTSVTERELVVRFGHHVDVLYENISLWRYLTELRDLFDSVGENVPHGLIAVNPAGQITALNSTAEFMFSVQKLFVLDAPLSEIFDTGLARLFTELMQTAIQGAVVEDREYEHSLGGKTSIRIGISASLIYNRHQELVGVLFLCRDLSMRQEIKHLRAVDQLKTEFLNTVSHELKTPLTALLGGIDILMADRAEMREDHAELVEVLADDVVRLQTLVYDLLDMARLQSGTAPLAQSCCVVHDLIREAVGFVRIDDSCEVSIEVDEGLPDIIVDAQKIQQALTNLVSNAVKYSPQGGQVQVRARADGAMLRIDVVDEGMGIHEDELPKIWDKFYRTRESSASEIEGTGLGLAIVKHIVDLHGGDAGVESTPGSGSTFSVSLPLVTGTIPGTPL